MLTCRYLTRPPRMWYTSCMRESFFRNLPSLTMEEAAKPSSLEERTYILNERMKEIGKARIRIDGRIVAASRTERTELSRTGS